MRLRLKVGRDVHMVCAVCLYSMPKKAWCWAGGGGIDKLWPPRFKAWGNFMVLEKRKTSYSKCMLSMNKGAGGKHRHACLGFKQVGCASPSYWKSTGWCLILAVAAQSRFTLVSCLLWRWQSLTQTRYLPELIAQGNFLPVNAICWLNICFLQPHAEQATAVREMKGGLFCGMALLGLSSVYRLR